MACTYCHADYDCDCTERIHCDKAGQVGHWHCGWCPLHDQPMFRCMCVHRGTAAVKPLCTDCDSGRWTGI